MGFFAFDEVGALRVSRVTWIYPAIVIPLTVTVFVTWAAWLKLRPNKIGLANKRLDEMLEQHRSDGAARGEL